ncbi:MAG: ecotin [Cyanobacteria bacterium K_DeepCast_35m_m2_023]|nr:ecotin [Cyanobacteria bacterium K_DeepCast_35m_m2_023]
MGAVLPGDPVAWLRSVSLAAALGAALLAQPAAAIPRLDLSAYPAPAAGERRWVIQLPGVLPPSHDPALASDPRDWRVQLIVGQTAWVDCNQFSFSARLRAWTPRPGEQPIYRVDNVGSLLSTKMACPAGQAARKLFVPMAGKPYVVPYNASRPIVIDAPAPIELRWRLWKAERESRPALAL